MLPQRPCKPTALVLLALVTLVAATSPSANAALFGWLKPSAKPLPSETRRDTRPVGPLVEQHLSPTESELRAGQARESIRGLRAAIGGLKSLGIDLADPAAVSRVSFGVIPLPQYFVDQAIAELQALRKLDKDPRAAAELKVLAASLIAELKVDDRLLDGRFVTRDALDRINDLADASLDLSDAPEFKLPEASPRKLRATEELPSLLSRKMNRFRDAVKIVAKTSGVADELIAEGERLREAIAAHSEAPSKASATAVRARVGEYIVNVYRAGVILEAAGDTTTPLMPAGLQRAIAPFVSEGQRMLLIQVSRHH